MANSRRSRRTAGASRGSWAESRGRVIYNLAILGAAAICGLILVVAPHLIGATPGARPWGAVLAGYALVRGYYIYRRFREQSRARAASRQGNRP